MIKDQCSANDRPDIGLCLRMHTPRGSVGLPVAVILDPSHSGSFTIIAVG